MTRRPRFTAAAVCAGMLAVGVLTPTQATANGIYGSGTVSVIPEPYILATSGFEGPTVSLNLSKLQDPNHFLFRDDSGEVSDVTVTRNGAPIALQEPRSFVSGGGTYDRYAELATATGTPAGGTWRVSYTVNLAGLWYCSIHSANGCSWIRPRTFQVADDSPDGVVSQPTLAPRIRGDVSPNGRRVEVVGVGENQGLTLDGSIAVQMRGSSGVWRTLRSRAYSLSLGKVSLKANPSGRRAFFRAGQTANGGWAQGYSKKITFVKKTVKDTVRERVDGKTVKRVVKRKAWVEKH